MVALLIFLGICSASAQLDNEEMKIEDDDNFFDGYHEPVGIPATAIIIAREETFLSGTSRIYEGYNVDNEQFPFFAGLFIVFGVPTKTYSSCGSTLLSSDRVVTAAHCWNDGKLQAKKLIVVLGSQFLTFGGLRVQTDKVMNHPNFTTRPVRNDIGIIYLPYKINFTFSIFPIALPNAKELDLTFESYLGGVLGYGLTKNSAENRARDGPSLKFVTLRIMANDECRKSYRAQPVASQMCTSGEGGKASCDGDSGGPLFTYTAGTHRKILVGVISTRKKNTTCGDFPAVHTRVTQYMDFIATHVDIPSIAFEYRHNGEVLIEKDTLTVYPRAAHAALKYIS